MLSQMQCSFITPPRSNAGPAVLIFIAVLLFSADVLAAEHVPIVRMDAEDCELRSWHNLGGCFQNKTGAEIKDAAVNYRQSIYYSDKRTKIVAVIPMQDTRADRNIVISTSGNVMQKNIIKTIVNELIIGKNIDGGMIPGCQFEMHERSPISTLALIKTSSGYRCQALNF